MLIFTTTSPVSLSLFLPLFFLVFFSSFPLFFSHFSSLYLLLFLSLFRAFPSFFHVSRFASPHVESYVFTRDKILTSELITPTSPSGVSVIDTHFPDIERGRYCFFSMLMSIPNIDTEYCCNNPIRVRVAKGGPQPRRPGFRAL